MGGLHVKHETKKRFAKAKTSTKKIENGINAEFTDNRQKLALVSASLKTLLKQINSTSKIWAGVTRHQRSFAESLVAAFPSEGPVRQHAQEVEATVRDLERSLDKESNLATHNRLVTILNDYQALITGVEKEYPTVEASFSEVLRYQRKVDRLEKKVQRQEIHNRNLEKLHATRAEHDGSISALIQRMKNVYNKHEVVFQCAHHAFWIAHDTYGQTVNEATKLIRLESVSTKEHLVGINITTAPTFPPVSRVPLITAPTDQVTSAVTTTSATNLEHNKPQVTVISSTPASMTTASSNKVSEPQHEKPHVTVVSSTPTPTTTHVVTTQNEVTPTTSEIPNLPTPPTQAPFPLPAQTKQKTQSQGKLSMTEKLFGRSKRTRDVNATPQPA